MDIQIVNNIEERIKSLFGIDYIVSFEDNKIYVKGRCIGSALLNLISDILIDNELHWIIESSQYYSRVTTLIIYDESSIQTH